MQNYPPRDSILQHPCRLCSYVNIQLGPCRYYQSIIFNWRPLERIPCAPTWIMSVFSMQCAFFVTRQKWSGPIFSVSLFEWAVSPVLMSMHEHYFTCLLLSKLPSTTSCCTLFQKLLSFSCETPSVSVLHKHVLLFAKIVLYCSWRKIWLSGIKCGIAVE